MMRRGNIAGVLTCWLAQVCVAPDYILVPREAQDALVDALVEA